MPAENKIKSKIFKAEARGWKASGIWSSKKPYLSSNVCLFICYVQGSVNRQGLLTQGSPA